MTQARLDELIKQCADDLEEARRQGHKTWDKTLRERLAWLQNLKEYDRPKIVEGRRW